jgi:NitT/TauT family transport system ATP-binding protein
MTVESVGAAYINVRSVSKSFARRGTTRDDRTKVLDGISVSVARDEFVSIIGPSGCGKTTLLRLLAGLERPDAGAVLVGGRDVDRPSPERALVFQQSALLPWASVADNVALGLRMKGMGKRESRQKALPLLESLGLGGFEDHLPRQLSGGMQQRVALARAFVLNPSVLLMDEPFASLDEITRRRLHAELMSLWERESRTGVFITHNVDEAILLADRVVIMSPRPGRVADIVPVRLPRPRRLEHDQLPEFADTRRHIWKQIEEWGT